METDIQQAIDSFLEDLGTLDVSEDVFKAFSLLMEQNSGGLALGYWLAHSESQSLRLMGWVGLGIRGQDSPSYVKGLFCPIFAEMMHKKDLSVFRREMTDYRGQYGPGWGWLKKYLPGLSALVVPLTPSDDELYGVIIAYRKGEQPFLDSDVALAKGVSSGIVDALIRISGE